MFHEHYMRVNLSKEFTPRRATTGQGKNPGPIARGKEE